MRVERCSSELLFPIQELSPEGYSWTGNALRGAMPYSGMGSKRLFLDWEHAAALPAPLEPAQPAFRAPPRPALPRPARPRPAPPRPTPPRPAPPRPALLRPARWMSGFWIRQVNTYMLRHGMAAKRISQERRVCLLGNPGAIQIPGERAERTTSKVVWKRPSLLMKERR